MDDVVFYMFFFDGFVEIFLDCFECFDFCFVGMGGC